MQGFGFDPNLRYIRIARNNREITDVVFRQQIITTVSQIENIYWDLVTAYEAVQVNQRALELANKVLSDDQEQVKIGTMAPITLAQAESGVATAKQNLIVAQTNLQLEQLLMKNAITKNMQDPLLAEAPVIPTDTLKPDEQYEVRPIDELIQEALQAVRRSPRRASTSPTWKSRASRSRTPCCRRWTLYAFYGASGLAGQQNPLFPPVLRRTIQGELLSAGHYSIPATALRFSNLFNSSGPDKGMGVNLNIPLRNRAGAGQPGSLRPGIPPGPGRVAADREPDHAAGPAGAVRHAAELCRVAGGNRGPRFCARKPDRRAEEVHLRRLDAHAGLAGLQQPDHGRVERAERCGQL